MKKEKLTNLLFFSITDSLFFLIGFFLDATVVLALILSGLGDVFFYTGLASPLLLVIVSVILYNLFSCKKTKALWNILFIISILASFTIGCLFAAFLAEYSPNLYQTILDCFEFCFRWVFDILKWFVNLFNEGYCQ